MLLPASAAIIRSRISSPVLNSFGSPAAAYWSTWRANGSAAGNGIACLQCAASTAPCRRGICPALPASSARAPAVTGYGSRSVARGLRPRTVFFWANAAGKRRRGHMLAALLLFGSALCTKRTVHMRTARFFRGADCDGGKKAFSSPFPRPRSVSCCFSAEKVPLPLLRKAKRGNAFLRFVFQDENALYASGSESPRSERNLSSSCWIKSEAAPRAHPSAQHAGMR